MSQILDKVARWLWYWILITSRKRRKWFFSQNLPWLTPERKERWRKRTVQQDRFARKYGVPAIRLALLILWSAIFLTLAMIVVQKMLESGMLDSRSSR